jgi:hypothetical protein
MVPVEALKAASHAALGSGKNCKKKTGKNPKRSNEINII